MMSVRHTREIVRDDAGGEPEYAVYCSCKTFRRTRLTTFAAAAGLQHVHLARVADGTWGAEQAAEAARLAALAPLHAAQTEQFEAREERQSAGFEVIIAKQHGGDVEAARARLEAARARLDAADAALLAVAPR